MKADLCVHTLKNTLNAYPALEGATIHSDRGTQYPSEIYRKAIQDSHIHQSMNSAGGRCHDNARCESMWARMKTELLYDRCDTEQMRVEEPLRDFSPSASTILHMAHPFSEKLNSPWRKSMYFTALFAID